MQRPRDFALPRHGEHRDRWLSEKMRLLAPADNRQDTLLRGRATPQCWRPFARLVRDGSAPSALSPEKEIDHREVPPPCRTVER